MLKGIRNNNYNSNSQRMGNRQNQGYLKKRNFKKCQDRDFRHGGDSYHWDEEKWQIQGEIYESTYRGRQSEIYREKNQSQQRQDNWGNDNYNRQVNHNKKTLKYRPKYQKQNRDQSHQDKCQVRYSKDRDYRTYKNNKGQDGQKYSQFHNNELDYKSSYTKGNGKNNCNRYRNFKGKNNKNYSNLNQSDFDGGLEEKTSNLKENTKTNLSKEILSTDQDGRSTNSETENIELLSNHEAFFIEIYGRNCQIILNNIENFQKSMKKVYEVLDYKSSEVAELAIKLIILDQICSTKSFLSRSVLFEFKKMYDQTSKSYQNTRLAIRQ